MSPYTARRPTSLVVASPTPAQRLPVQRLLLRHSLDLEEEAAAIEAAIAAAISGGNRTADIATENERAISTDEMTDEIIRCLS